MPSSFFGIDIAAKGASAYNAGILTSAHNLANVDTEGYSRQDIVKKAGVPISLGSKYGMVGTGSEVNEINNSRDVYYDFKYRKSNSVNNLYETENTFLKNIEGYLYINDEKSGGLTNTLNSLFSAISDLTTDASDRTKRAQVTGFAKTLTENCNEIANNLHQLQKSVNGEIADDVNKINSYAGQIASLTKQINNIEVYGGKANDLRDARATVVDKLSSLINVDVVEKAATDNGVNQYIVYADNALLVDTYTFNTLEMTASDTRNNQSDADGLYELKWSNGQTFNVNSDSLSGELQGLINIRDGNNKETFRAQVTNNGLDEPASSGSYGEGDVFVTMVADPNDNKDWNESENSLALAKLSIPETNGLIHVANADFAYESFSVNIESDGKYVYTFKLKEPLKKSDADYINDAINVAAKANSADSGDLNEDTKKRNIALIGKDVEYRGIPYYFAQLNEFIRTFSASFNQQQDKGYDLNGEHGKDLFTCTSNVSTAEAELDEFNYNNLDGFYYFNGDKVVDKAKNTKLISEGYTFGDYRDDDGKLVTDVKDKDGNVIGTYKKLYKNGEDKTNPKAGERIFIPADEKKIFSFDSMSAPDKNGNLQTSYYSMTAGNMKAKTAIVNDANLFAAAERNPKKESGASEGDNLEKISRLKEDVNMFKQGNPVSFLSTLTATVGVDSDRAGDSAKNTKNILDSIQKMRMSKSGVDEDEETERLVRYRNLLNYQYKVISIFNSIYDTLINNTGVG
ncbi:MAG: hypothetical protein VZR00_01695 [Lachnospiraceae bacterium]|nr:hypothetical protein [Lachnospiraceae bacterium]MEE3460589.1 hypothetical protein [Lachnospiraceae bacterium]